MSCPHLGKLVYIHTRGLTDCVVRGIRTTDAHLKKQPQRLPISQLMSPVGQGTKCVLAAQFYLSISLVGFTRVTSFLLLLTDCPGMMARPCKSAPGGMMPSPGMVGHETQIWTQVSGETAGTGG